MGMIGAGFGNKAQEYGTVAGGLENELSSQSYGVIVGGFSNTVTSSWAQSILGGENNYVSGELANILGGSRNTVSARVSTVLGGADNKIDNYGYASGIAGGSFNSASSYYSLAIGHDAYATSYNSAVFGFSQDSCYAIGPNTINICTDDGGMFSNGEPVGSNPIDDSNSMKTEYITGNTLSYATVNGGYKNTASAEYATVAGGRLNRAQGTYSFVGGGYANKVLSNYGTIGGGFKNMVQGRFGTVIGGSRSTASGRFSVAAGFAAVANEDYSAAFGFDPNSICTVDSQNHVAFCAELFTINDADVFDMSRRRRELSEEHYKSTDSDAKLIDEMIATAQQHEKIGTESEALISKLQVTADRLLTLASNR